MIRIAILLVAGAALAGMVTFSSPASRSPLADEGRLPDLGGAEKLRALDIPVSTLVSFQGH